jgi:hypothetical protein
MLLYKFYFRNNFENFKNDNLPKLSFGNVAHLVRTSFAAEFQNFLGFSKVNEFSTFSHHYLIRF